MKHHEELALKFGRYIVRKDWEVAHILLSEALRSSISVNDIEHAVRKMIAYAGDEILEAEVVIAMEEWPEKDKTDVGLAYVSLAGSTFSEGVTVVVTRENGNPAIRRIEWGRP